MLFKWTFSKDNSFSYIQSYLNYENIGWASTYATELKKINLLQKRVVRFMFNEERLFHSRPLLRKVNALDFYWINLYQHLNFTHEVNNQSIFNDLIKKPAYKYLTNCSKSHFCLKNVSINSTKYLISFRGTKLWIEILHEEEKEFEFYLLFQNKIKPKLLMIENETKYF